MEPEHSFRDTIGTLDDEGKRKFVYPKKPTGKLYEYRKIVSYALLAFFLAAPFVKINGNQFLLFNVIERRFNFFGFPFWPQDFYLVVIAMVIGVVFIALFTVVYGRIFCGWICPQTIFLEMVFRRIEYWIDGDASAQRRLDKQKWDAEKIRKRLLKWFLFFVISFLIANIFLAYAIGGDQLLKIVVEGPMAHLGNFIALLIFTGVFYFVYAWFREQVCLIVCPYGRLQGVLLDNKTINVAYDFVRGESASGRGKIKKGEDRATSGKGDCIDCSLCVHVCPMAIDIRNGTQMECTNCTACIDACDSIMQNVGFEKGLIRYASEDEIVKKEKFRFTLRMKAYTAVLGILVGAFVVLLSLRSDLDVALLRVPGQLYQHQNDSIRNVYTFRAINKTPNKLHDVHFKLLTPHGKISMVGKRSVDIAKENEIRGTVFLDIWQPEVKDDKMKIEIGIYAGNKLIATKRATFLGPRKF